MGGVREGGHGRQGPRPGVRERSWGDFRRFLAGCMPLGELQEVTESARRVVDGFGEVPERFSDVHGR